MRMPSYGLSKRQEVFRRIGGHGTVLAGNNAETGEAAIFRKTKTAQKQTMLRPRVWAALRPKLQARCFDKELEKQKRKLYWKTYPKSGFNWRNGVALWRTKRDCGHFQAEPLCAAGTKSGWKDIAEPAVDILHRRNPGDSARTRSGCVAGT